MIGSLVSCEKQKMEDMGFDPMDATKGAKVTITERTVSTPVSDLEEVTPYMIPGVNRGGNRTCAEVELEWGLEEGTFLCGEKVDWDGDGFASDFPIGLTVWVDDIYVGFEMNQCIVIDNTPYMVGAVIVKGSNAANVYYYENGILTDEGLAAPGDKHMVSNLTFCLVPCDGKEVLGVLALKTYLEFESNGANYAISGGTPVPNEDLQIGFNYVFSGTLNTFDLVLHHSFPGDRLIGTITAEVVGSDLVITVDTFDDDVRFENTYLYFGPEADLPGYYKNYTEYPASDPLAESLTFTIPL